MDDSVAAPRAPTADASGRSDARSRWTTAVVLAVVGLVLASNVVWIALDHQAPSWDQAHYLHVSFQWRRALSDGGLHGMVSAFYDTDPTYAPLYMLAITPFEALREGVDAALVANTLMFGGTVLTAAVIASRLFGQRAAPAAAVFVATCPIIYGLSRTPLVDTLLVLLVALSVMAAVVSAGFRRRGWAILCGVFVGLATLTKITAPGIILAPVLCTLALPERIIPRRQLTNAVLAAIVAVAVALPWYSVNLSPSIDYLRSTTSGQLAIGTTRDPLELDALLRFTSVTISSGVGTILLLVLVVAGALASRRLLHRRVRRQDLARIAIPASWFVVPFAVLAVSNNQDVRYLAPGIIGLTVLAAGAVAAIRPRVVGAILLGAAGTVLAIQFLTFLAPLPSTGSATFGVSRESFKLAVPFDGKPLAYTRKPGLPDYATPIVRALIDDRAHAPPATPLSVCLLATHRVVNGNTLRYVAAARGTPLWFTDVSYVPRISDEQLAAMLTRCRAALSVVDSSESGRVAVLNRSSAAARLTRAQLSEFNGPRETFPVGGGATAQLLRRSP